MKTNKAADSMRDSSYDKNVAVQLLPPYLINLPQPFDYEVRACYKEVPLLNTTNNNIVRLSLLFLGLIYCNNQYCFSLFILLLVSSLFIFYYFFTHVEFLSKTECFNRYFDVESMHA